MKRVLALLAGLLLSSSLGSVARSQGRTWDFENGSAMWRPSAPTLTLSRANHARAARNNRAALHLEGQVADWHYAQSETVPLRAGQFYRLAGRLRVEKVGPARLMPYLQCAFVGEDGKSILGWGNTHRYDGSKMGRWQHLSGEFQAPPGTAQCWVSLETSTDSAVQIDAFLDDVTLEAVPRLASLDVYRLPFPPSLRRVQHQHPRLYLNAPRVANLRAEIQTTHRALWQEVLLKADEFAQSAPPPSLQPAGDDDEQQWQRDVGDAMPFLALAYLLTREPKYLDAARAWALASCAYATWGVDAPREGVDLAAGHQLFGLAIVYDWCFNELGEAARQTIRATLVRRASHMFAVAARGEAWWHESYLQNHLWVNSGGLAAAGLALFDEENDAALWIGFALDKLRRTESALGPDGASHEGAAYWTYGVEALLKTMFLARDLLGVDLYHHPWWRSTAAYRQYVALPRRAWTKNNNIVDLGDSPRRNWYGPDYLLRALAHEYGDPHAQWLASEIDAANVDNPQSRWLNLIWFDPKIAAQPPTGRPTLHHFADMGLVSARSAWSGDESLLVFKCGPFIGHQAARAFGYDPGGTHVHPDANHFVLFGAGEWLLRDDGPGPKWTGRHNTLLIDKRGQLGEGKASFKGAEALSATPQPRVLRAASSARLDFISGDAAGAYPPDLGLRRYRRHLLFLKPDVLIVLDDIALAAPRALELRFHPQSRQTTKEDAAFLARGEGALLRMEPLTLGGAHVSLEDTATQSRGGAKEAPMFALRCTAQTAHWRNAVAFSWSKGTSPVKVALRTSGLRWTFSAGTRAVTFDWATAQVLLPFEH